MGNLILYELRRSIARKKVISLIAITVFFEVGVYVALSEVRSPRIEQLISPIQPILWLAGVLLPQSLLLHFIAISIASGSLSEEYEQGTVDFFLTKPITRAKFGLGKLIGGYILVISIYMLMVTLALALSEILFGYQVELQYLPGLVATVIFSSLTFYAISFMSGELLRRSSLAFLISSSILIGSVLIGAVLVFVARLTGDQVFNSVAISLPSWGATELPFLYAGSIPGASVIVQALEIFPAIPGTQVDAVVLTLGYSIVSFIFAFMSLLSRDIPKRVS
ncbi:ABC transporter permease [Metallosphaera tengchongensis]|uniref:ABC transporter permease n=1 Tax=Metallosphaera tengchongensis TaxID=1532350 RepID=A0A6N0NU56_9CREN|nr:ABC transporter permease [Metallosphaera tengchongensis]